MDESNHYSRIINDDCCDDGDAKKLYSSPGWIAMMFYEIFLICHAAATTRNEAMNVGSNLHRLTAKTLNMEWKTKASEMR